MRKGLAQDFVQGTVLVVSARVLQFPPMGGKQIPEAMLPNRIRVLRKAAGKTLQQLAPGAGISFHHLAKIETGERELTHPVMERVAAALGVPVADLLLPQEGGLTEHERRLIDTYRQVPPAARAALDAVAESQQPFRGADPENVVTLRRA